MLDFHALTGPLHSTRAYSEVSPFPETTSDIGGADGGGDWPFSSPGATSCSPGCQPNAITPGVPDSSWPSY